VTGCVAGSCDSSVIFTEIARCSVGDSDISIICVKILFDIVTSLISDRDLPALITQKPLINHYSVKVLVELIQFVMNVFLVQLCSVS
jgi:hypothetical protein